MNYKSKFTHLILSFLVIAGFTSCSSDDDAGTPIDSFPTTFEIISNSENHTILTSLILETNLDEVLDSGTFTVFAPDDAAFEGVDASDFTQEELTTLLLNHVVNGNASSQNLSNGYIETNARESFSGNEHRINMFINLTDGVNLNGASTVTSPDLTANNGIVHVVDNIIPVPDMVTFATADPQFATLVEAITREDQPSFVDILSTPAGEEPSPFTLFAPNNDAFQNTLAFLIQAGTGITGLEDLPQQTLEEAISLHLIAGGNVRASDLSDGPVETFGGTIEIDLSDGAKIIDPNGREIQILTTNIQTSNGVLHVIDNVILPDLDVDELPTLVEAAEAAGLTLLLDAVGAVEGLGETLLNEDEITVFAPTNEAFEDALEAYNAENLEELVEAIGGIENLETVLGFHVVPAVAFSQDLEMGDNTFETLSGQDITVNVNGENVTVIDANGNVANVIQPDVAIENGVVHVIDTVLLPELAMDVNEVTIVLGNDEASAYFVSEIVGDENVSALNENNSTWTLTTGTRYTIEVENAGPHPIALRDAMDEFLLAQDESEGSFENIADVNFVAEGNSISFTLTPALANELENYVCINHASMTGSIITQ